MGLLQAGPEAGGLFSDDVRTYIGFFVNDNRRDKLQSIFLAFNISASIAVMRVITVNAIVKAEMFTAVSTFYLMHRPLF